jgi:two-component system CheB/CheR fusion protein
MVKKSRKKSVREADAPRRKAKRGRVVVSMAGVAPVSDLKETTKDLLSTIDRLQSLNEELTTVNSRLQEKVQELDPANCDISNLMVSADIAMLFLDDQLCVQRFTPPAGRLLNLRDTDIGRPFRAFAPTMHDDSLPSDCRRVLREGSFAEKEVWSLERATGPFESTAAQTDAKPARRCYLRRIVPYRSGDQSVDGIVITLLDITSRIESEAETRRLATVLRDSNDAVMVLDLSGQITTCNAGAAHMYGYTETETLQLNILDIVPSEDKETLRAMLVHIKRGRHVDSFESKRTT